MYYDESRQRYIMEVPAECPDCKYDLETDICTNSTYLRCPNCDYELDITKELAATAEINGEE